VVVAFGVVVPPVSGTASVSGTADVSTGTLYSPTSSCTPRLHQDTFVVVAVLLNRSPADGSLEAVFPTLSSAFVPTSFSKDSAGSQHVPPPLLHPVYHG